MISTAKNFVIAIPGRIESSRLPNKLLLEIDGKSIITRVLEQCLKAVEREKIVLCTDSDKLSIKAKELEINSILTKKGCKSGTDRIASISNELIKIANNIKDERNSFEEEIIKNTLIINVQGDQPFLDPKLIKEMINFCFNDQTIPPLTTPIYKLDPTAIHNPNVVKTLINNKRQAIYFSRSALPHCRDDDKKNWHNNYNYHGHVGIYGYRADILLKWPSLATSKLENCEKLEQLKFIDSGYIYETFLTNENHLSIDTRKQYLDAIQYYKMKKTEI